MGWKRIRVSSRPWACTCTLAESEVSPPARPGPRDTSNAATPGTSATSIANEVTRPRTVGRTAAADSATQATPRTPAIPPGVTQWPTWWARPGTVVRRGTSQPAKTTTPVTATRPQTCREARWGAAARARPSAMQAAIATIDRTRNCPPCTRRNGSSIACTTAMPARHPVAAERSVASRRVSAGASAPALSVRSVTTARGSDRAVLMLTEGSPGRPSAGLRREDLPAEHHVVVLVGQVVAVRHVRAGEGPESAGDDDLLARVQGDHVLLAGVVGVTAVRRRLAVAGHHQVLLHVEVERVDPAAAAVADPPHLAAQGRVVRALPRRGQRRGRVELQAVDQPLGLGGGGHGAALELERRDGGALDRRDGALDERRDVAQLGDRGRVLAVVGHLVGGDHELDQRDLVARVGQVPHAARGHLHRVDEVDLVARLRVEAVLVLAEVDD